MAITPNDPANFTPARGSYKELSPFRFWCQKVLPMVYDDSLSYYELLNKVVDYLNKTMEDVETLEGDVTGLHEAYVELQKYVNDYFESLDVQEEINNKLDEMAEDGSLNALVTPFIPDLVSDWLDEHITPTTPIIDNTLRIRGAGADAEKTGIEIDALNSKVGNGFSPTILPRNTDLNTVFDIGVWYLNSNYNFINYPYNNAYSSYLIIISTGTIVQQILIPYFFSNTAPALNEQCVRRNYFGTNWSTWKAFEYKNNEILANSALLFHYNVQSGSNLNDLTDNGVYFIPSGLNLANYPYDSLYGSWLITFGDTIKQQIVIPYFFSSTAPALSLPILRRNYNGTTWSAWNRTEPDDRVISTTDSDPFNGQTNVDLNLVTGNHFYLLSDRHTYSNIPTGFTIGFLETVKTNNWNLQFLIQFNGGTIWKRYGNPDGSQWEIWRKIASNNAYEFYTNENTYNISSSPIITTDTNNYLASTEDDTDRTSDISTMLVTNKICNLGSGIYYVKDLEMPEGTAIHGSGSGTKIIMKSGSGCAIQLNSFCEITDCMILGSANNISKPSVIGDRHGILWSGTYTEDETPTNQPQMGIINNVWIRYFTGGGITCQNTGYGTFNQIEVNNVYIDTCGVGVYIPYWSEFNKFTNVRTYNCLYGCINNGGNNIFVNCDFSRCTHGFVMNNSQNQSPNNSHGSCVGCIFNHTDNNTGIGIEILNCDNGFIFDGCQIFFSQINIEDSDGVVVSNSNFGYENCSITISNGGTILFSNNLYQDDVTISITNNNNVHFVNNYIRSNGNIVEP